MELRCRSFIVDAKKCIPFFSYEFDNSISGTISRQSYKIIKYKIIHESKTDLTFLILK